MKNRRRSGAFFSARTSFNLRIRGDRRHTYSGGEGPPAALGSRQEAVFAGGCFWGVDAVFNHVKGVDRVVAGYAGGGPSTAQYEVVSTGTTGHAESVEVTYDPSQVSYNDLLKVFFYAAHDPTELNRQAPIQGRNTARRFSIRTRVRKGTPTLTSRNSPTRKRSPIRSSPRWLRSRASIRPRPTIKIISRGILTTRTSLSTTCPSSICCVKNFPSSTNLRATFPVRATSLVALRSG